MVTYEIVKLKEYFTSFLEKMDIFEANRDKEYGARALSKRFGVAHQTISAVASGQNWKETSK